jgi:hypothetical protein
MLQVGATEEEQEQEEYCQLIVCVKITLMIGTILKSETCAP